MQPKWPSLIRSSSRRRLLALALPTLILMAGLSALELRRGPSRTLIAVAAGERIYEDELPPIVTQQVMQLRYEEYKTRADALNNLLSERLLDSEARREGLSTAALLRKHVPPAPPSSTELYAFYRAHPQDFKGTFETEKPRIGATLVASRVADARRIYLQTLHAGERASVLLLPPRTSVSPDWTRIRGNSGAPVMIVEFADFQCLFCREAEPVLRSLLAEYKDQISLSFRDFPLRAVHPQAELAAEAARCAGEQRKFWQYHDLLFADDRKLDPAGLSRDAALIGIELAQFETCLSSGRYAQGIRNDIADGERAGVGGTPTFIIDGYFLPGVQSKHEFERIIDLLLSGERTAP
ncbi:MAG: DsbA family protein [Acidobacteriota bacterium]|nr:DsbA family protein [Acidobacteriota bacterium]